MMKKEYVAPAVNVRIFGMQEDITGEIGISIIPEEGVEDW